MIMFRYLVDVSYFIVIIHDTKVVSQNVDYEIMRSSLKLLGNNLVRFSSLNENIYYFHNLVAKLLFKSYHEKKKTLIIKYQSITHINN